MQLVPTPDLSKRRFTRLHKIVLGLLQVPFTSQFLGSESSVDDVDANGLSALHWAARIGRADLISLILGLGVDPNMRTQHGETALHFAADVGAVECIHALLDGGADPAPFSKRSRVTPLHRAAAKGRLGSVLALLAAGAPVNATHRFGDVALTNAILAGSAECTEVLLAHGADPNCCDGSGVFGLMDAVMCNAHGVIDALLRYGARLDVKSQDKQTILHVLAQYADVETVEIFLRSNVVDTMRSCLDISACDKAGHTPVQLLEGRASKQDPVFEAFQALVFEIGSGWGLEMKTSTKTVLESDNLTDVSEEFFDTLELFV